MALKIVHIALGKANPNRSNGVNKVVNSLAEAQSKLGYEVELWGVTKSLEHNYPERTYTTRLFKDTGKFSIDSALVSAIKQTDKEEVIFHLHGGFIPHFLFITRHLVSQKLPYIITPHGAYNLIAMQRSKVKKLIYLQTFEKYVVENAKCVHLIGNSEIEGTVKTFGKVPIALIQNGQESEELEASLDSSKFWNTHPVFGFVGRIDAKTKGLDLLFRAAAEVLENTGVSPEIRLIGDGPDMNDLKTMAQDLKISESVKFLGSKYGEEKNQELAKCNFLCLNSRNEGMPGVVLEAASLGVPCIISKETNMEQFVKLHKSGFVTAKNASKEIAKCLTEAGAMHKNAYDGMCQNAVKMVIKEFNWSDIAKKHIEVYEK